MNIGLKRGTVELVEYNPKWSSLFEQEKKLLLDTFGERILAVAHIGSTAIPDLPAKPIIDMNVAVKSLDDIDDFISKLQELGYEYISERRYADRQFFPKGPSEFRTHHLNLVELDSQTAWVNQLLFRDYLRSHKKDRDAYADLKRKLADKFADNREEYTERKSKFVLEIIDKAQKQSHENKSVKKSIQLTTESLEELLKNSESLDFRLDQEVWRELKAGDYIEFWEDFTGWQKEPTEDSRKAIVKIEHIYKAQTFKELFGVIEKEFTRLGDKDNLLKNLRNWWSENKEVDEGVLAFYVVLAK